MITHGSKTQAILDYVDGQAVWVKHSLAILIVVIAAFATIHVPALAIHAPFLLFFFAVLQASFWLGLHQGIVTMAASLFAANRFVLLPLCTSTPDNIFILNAGFCALSATMIATTCLHRRLTKALKENRHDMDQAQFVGQIGSWRMNVQYNELNWSEQNHRIFGIPKGTPMSYETFLSCVHPDDRSYVDEMWQACLQGEAYDIEHRLIVDGNVKWVREKAKLEFDKNGKLIGGFGTTQDITHRKETEAILKENQRLLAESQAIAHIGSWVMDMNSGRISWSEEGLRLYGFSAEINPDITFDQFLAILHSDDRSAMRAWCDACAAGEAPKELEFRIYKPDGTISWLQGCGKLETKSDGQPVRMVGTVQDINGRKRAEKELLESTQRLRLATEATGVGIWEWNVLSNQIRWDTQMFRLYGMTPTADGFIDYGTWIRSVLPEDQARQEQVLRDTVCQRGRSTRQFRILRADDKEYRHIQAVETVRTNELGQVEWVVGTNLDTTELTRAMETVRAGEAFMRDLLNSLPEYVVLLDEHGIVSAVNEPWERFSLAHGGAPSELSVGANYLDVCRRSVEAGNQDAGKIVEGLRALLAGQQQEFFMEYPYPTPERLLWFLTHAKRVNHSFDGVIITHVDITEHKAAEDMLRETEARLALLVEAVHAGYWDWDLKSRTLYLSPECKQQIGFDQQELLDSWEVWESRLHPDDRDKVVKAAENYIAGSETDNELEFRLLHKDGSYRWIHSRGGLLRDSTNRPYRMLGINLDITDYMKSQALAERRNKMEHSFRLSLATQTASAIAHELNQPLTAINSYADVALKLLRIGNTDKQKISHALEGCSQQARRAAEVIRQLLNQLQQTETIREPVDINLAVNEALEFILKDKEYNGFNIKLDLADNLPLVTANSLQIQKVLLNLIGNGLESMQDRGKGAENMTITTRCSNDDPDMVQVSVCDSGKGVADAVALRTLFQPFYTTKATGLGMGLAISRSLIQSFGGSMWAERNADIGLSIHFNLPFAK